MVKIEARCRQVRDDALTAPPTGMATAAGEASAASYERELKAAVSEFRSEAGRADTERHADRHARQEAELALQRLRGEVDVLREELLRRKVPSQPASPLLSAVPPEHRQSSTWEPQLIPPPVIRFASAPVKERPDKVPMLQVLPEVQMQPQMQPQPELMRWGPQINATQNNSGTSTPPPPPNITE